MKFHFSIAGIFADFSWLDCLPLARQRFLRARSLEFCADVTRSHIRRCFSPSFRMPSPVYHAKALTLAAIMIGARAVMLIARHAPCRGARRTLDLFYI